MHTQIESTETYTQAPENSQCYRYVGINLSEKKYIKYNSMYIIVIWPDSNGKRNQSLDLAFVNVPCMITGY